MTGFKTPQWYLDECARRGITLAPIVPSPHPGYCEYGYSHVTYLKCPEPKCQMPAGLSPAEYPEPPTHNGSPNHDSHGIPFGSGPSGGVATWVRREDGYWYEPIEIEDAADALQ